MSTQRIRLHRGGAGRVHVHAPGVERMRRARGALGRSLSPKQGLVLGDSACVIITLFLASIVRFGYQGGAYFLLDSWARIPVSLGAFLFSLYWFGLYDLGKRKARRVLLLDLTKAVAAGVVLDIVLQYGLYIVPTGRGVATLNGVLLSGTIFCWRTVFEEGRRQKLYTQSALILGTDEAARAVYRLVQAHRHEGIRVVGFVGNGAGTPSEVLEKAVYREDDDFGERLDRDDIRLVIVPGLAGRQLSRARQMCLLACLERNVEVITTPLLYERLTGKVPCELASTEWFIQSMVGKDRKRMLLLKRLFDVAVASVALIVLAPLLAVVGLLVWISSSGGVLFLQERVGQNGRIFRIMKFRTMREDAERETGPVMARRSDRRVTAVGRILRLWHVDELPQLLNVLRGEMSLVGPRPERPVFVKKLEGHVPLYNERHALPPGMTGWAQVKFRYCASLKENITKFEYDLYYIKNASIVLDVFILLETARRVLQGQRPWRA